MQPEDVDHATAVTFPEADVVQPSGAEHGGAGAGRADVGRLVQLGRVAPAALEAVAIPDERVVPLVSFVVRLIETPAGCREQVGPV